MISKGAFVILLACASVATATSGKSSSKGDDILVSTDCKTWKKPRALPSAAYYKQNNSVSYIDYPNRMYAVFDEKGGEPFVFDYSTPGWIHLISNRTLESVRAELKFDEDEIGGLMKSIMEVAGAQLNKNRWIVMLEKGAYFAFFTAKTCSAAPKAMGAFCRIGQAHCELAPSEHQKKPGDAESCLRELGFTRDDLRQSLEKTCENHASPAATNRISALVAKAQQCPDVDPVAVKKTASGTCRDLPALFSRIEKMK